MTSNPTRKWEKKLRNAKTSEQVAKAERMLRTLATPEPVKPNRKLTDEEVFASARKYNKGCYAERQQRERDDKKEKTLSLKTARRRKEINDEKAVLAQLAEGEAKMRDEARGEYAIHQLKRAADFKRLKAHEETLKVEYAGKLNALRAKILAENNQNQKKTKKVYRRIVENQIYIIETLIQEHMKAEGAEGAEGAEMSYEDAKRFIYSEMFREE